MCRSVAESYVLVPLQKAMGKTDKAIIYRVAEKSPLTDQYGPNPAVSLFVVEPC
jgi:hypothetical protein